MSTSSATDRLRRAAAYFKLGLTPPEAVAEVAMDLIADLPKNPAIVELAVVPPTTDAVSRLLGRALQTEGVGAPTDREAGLLVAREIAQAIVSGEIPPGAGARNLWWNVVRRVPILESELGHFVGLASEWEDDQNHRGDYEEDIRNAAAELLKDDSFGQ